MSIHKSKGATSSTSVQLRARSCCRNLLLPREYVWRCFDGYPNLIHSLRVFRVLALRTRRLKRQRRRRLRRFRCHLVSTHSLFPIRFGSFATSSRPIPTKASAGSMPHRESCRTFRSRKKPTPKTRQRLLFISQLIVHRRQELGKL